MAKMFETTTNKIVISSDKGEIWAVFHKENGQMVNPKDISTSETLIIATQLSMIAQENTEEESLAEWFLRVCTEGRQNSRFVFKKGDSMRVDICGLHMEMDFHEDTVLQDYLHMLRYLKTHGRNVQ